MLYKGNRDRNRLYGKSEKESETTDRNGSSGDPLYHQSAAGSGQGG